MFYDLINVNLFIKNSAWAIGGIERETLRYTNIKQLY